MNKQTHDFLDYLLNERKYSSKTVDSYKFDIEKFFDFLLKEGTLMDEVDQITIRNFLTDELNAGISKRSCKRRLSSLRHFYTYLTEHSAYWFLMYFLLVGHALIYPRAPLLFDPRLVTWSLLLLWIVTGISHIKKKEVAP